VPSTRSGEKLGGALRVRFESNLRLWSQAGQMVALCRMVALQCGQRRDFPGEPTLVVLTMLRQAPF
jgi:hypothetical protein